ncbi:MAG TPA: zinc ABC transporter substrate-binding protein [Marinobacter sp.]|nr:zinc ABC transporter substrate-binding protein [Marinobacter sp.]
MARSHFPQSTLILVLCLLIHSPLVVASTKIVTSIKPLELLVRAIAEDSVEVTTLVPAGASPHTYTMRPSQRRALEMADVIFWVGPDMENFLARLLAGADFHQRTVQLMEGEGQKHHDEHTALLSETVPDDHSHEGEDPHIWVDPAIALIMAREIRDTLAHLDGADTETLTHNLEQFEQTLKHTDARIRTMLMPAREISLFAYHSAFTRFAEHYNLKLEGVLTLNPELTPGARHIAEIQERLRDAHHACLLTEPQFNRQWWHSITRGLDVTFSTWDPLATDITANAEGYSAFQLSIAEAVLKCLP